MPNLQPSELELDLAEKELHLVDGTSPFDQAEIHWRNFLGYLQKAWNKVINECESDERFNPIRGVVGNLRRSDPLLSYLSKARDIDQHSAATLASFHIDTIPNVRSPMILSNTETGEEYHFNAQVGLIMFKVIPFEYKGQKEKKKTSTTTVYPPSMHLKEHLRDGTDPMVIGRIAIEFYRRKIAEVKIALGI